MSVTKLLARIVAKTDLDIDDDDSDTSDAAATLHGKSDTRFSNDFAPRLNYNPHNTTRLTSEHNTQTTPTESHLIL